MSEASYMTQQRPGTVTAAAVLNFVFGGIFVLCCGLNNLVQSLVPMSGFGGGAQGSVNVGKELREEIEKEAPGAQAVGAGAASLNIVFGIVMIVAGVGLLKMRSWARTLSIVVWLLVITAAIGGGAYNIVVTGPATERAMDTVTERHPDDPSIQILKGGLVSALTRAAGFVGVAIQCIVAAPVLILMLSGGTRRAFAGEGAVTPPADQGWGGNAPRPGQWDRGEQGDEGDQGIRPGGG